MEHIVDFGIAPKVDDISQLFDVSRSAVISALIELENYHGVVLHPKSSEVWIMHPFSTAPTNFWIESENKSWWGNCAWCSLGAAALINTDLTITTTLGGESKQVVIEIKDGEIQNKNLFIHFPIPMIKAWDNVTFTCSTMLIFETVAEIEDWCKRHAMKLGDIQPIDRVWAFSKVWYGNHLDQHWVKWSVDEARDIFNRFDLNSPIWDMPSTSGRF